MTAFFFFFLLGVYGGDSAGNMLDSGSVLSVFTFS